MRERSGRRKIGREGAVSEEQGAGSGEQKAGKSGGGETIRSFTENGKCPKWPQG